VASERASSGPLSRLASEIGRFGAVGAVAYVVDVGLFNLLRFGFDLGPLTSKTIATVAAITVAYFGNRHWTWRDRQRHSFRREYALFAVVNGAGLAIQLACLGLAVYALGLTGQVAENVAGNVVGVGLGTLFRFWAYRTWVFPRVPGDEPASRALGATTTTPY